MEASNQISPEIKVKMISKEHCQKKNKEDEEEDQKTSKKNNNRVEYHSSNTRHFSQFRAELLNNMVRQILKEN